MLYGKYSVIYKFFLPIINTRLYPQNSDNVINVSYYYFKIKCDKDIKTCYVIVTYLRRPSLHVFYVIIQTRPTFIFHHAYIRRCYVLALLLQPEEERSTGDLVLTSVQCITYVRRYGKTTRN